MRARPVCLTVATFLGFFLLGYGGIFIVGGNAHSSSPIWPATAFGFVMMLRLARSRGDDVAMLAAMFAASLLANKLGGAAPLVSLGFSLINVMDVAAGIAIMRRLGKPRLNTMMRVARFMLVAGIAPSLFGASLSALLIAWVGGNPWLTGLQWITSNLLGILILFPFGLTVSLRQFAKLRLQHRFLEAGLLFFTIAVLAYDNMHPTLVGYSQLANVILNAISNTEHITPDPKNVVTAQMVTDELLKSGVPTALRMGATESGNLFILHEALAYLGQKATPPPTPENKNATCAMVNALAVTGRVRREDATRQACQ